jgi:hypothetical protein
MKTLKIKLPKTPKARNPFFLLALRRSAGAHKPTETRQSMKVAVKRNLDGNY